MQTCKHYLIWEKRKKSTHKVFSIIFSLYSTCYCIYFIHKTCESNKRFHSQRQQTPKPDAQVPAATPPEETKKLSHSEFLQHLQHVCKSLSKLTDDCFSMIRKPLQVFFKYLMTLLACWFYSQSHEWPIEGHPFFRPEVSFRNLVWLTKAASVDPWDGLNGSVLVTKRFIHWTITKFLMIWWAWAHP